MNVLNLFVRTYSFLQRYPGMPFWVLTPLRRMVRWGANKILPTYLSKSNRTAKRGSCDVIVSLTSFPARINSVWQVVECMQRQSYKPAKIILWLSKEQFPSAESIPQSLKERVDDVFEIRLVDGDIRSHKKYYYVLKEFPNNFIFLIDDDIYYPTDIIENSWKAHLLYPDRVICNYGLKIGYDSNGNLMPYKKWTRVYHFITEDVFFGSGGGTLLSSSMLYKDVTDINLAQRLTPIADDIWLNAMVNLAGYQKTLLSNGLLLPINIDGNIRLSSQNRGKEQNDTQLESVISYYKDKLNINPFSQK